MASGIEDVASDCESGDDDAVCDCCIDWETVESVEDAVLCAPPFGPEACAAVLLAAKISGNSMHEWNSPLWRNLVIRTSPVTLYVFAAVAEGLSAPMPTHEPFTNYRHNL